MSLSGPSNLARQSASGPSRANRIIMGDKLSGLKSPKVRHSARKNSGTETALAGTACQLERRQ